MENLRILCCKESGGAFHYITRSWGSVFSFLGHDFRRWDGQHRTWKKFKPHLYLGSSGHSQPIPENLKSNTKIGLHVNPFGKNKLQRINGADVNEPQRTLAWVRKIKPDFVFGYGLQDDENRYWSGYRKKFGIPWYGVPTAGDALHFYKDFSSALTCDVGFIGGRWKYKQHNLDRYMIPLFKKYDYKCFGWGGWEKICKFEKLPDDTSADRKLFSSAKICPAICEPHTTHYGIDWPERIFKIPLAGGFTISDSINGFERYLPDCFPMAKDPAEFMTLCDRYLTDDKLREETAKMQHDYVLEHHTYFERVLTFLQASGFNEQAEHLKQKKAEFISSRLNV